MPNRKPPGDGSVKAIFEVLQAVGAERRRYGKCIADAVTAGDRLELERFRDLEKELRAVEPELIGHLMEALKREHNVR